jgi:hypothetical protein
MTHKGDLQMSAVGTSVDELERGLGVDWVHLREALARAVGIRA